MGGWGGWEAGAEGSLGRMGAWGGREYGAEGSMGRKGVWGGWEPGADGSMGRMGVRGGEEGQAERQCSESASGCFRVRARDPADSDLGTGKIRCRGRPTKEPCDKWLFENPFSFVLFALWITGSDWAACHPGLRRLVALP